jgi:hypothetical protein
VEGPRSAAELVSILQRVVQEQGVALVAARVEEEERQLNRRLREEQDAAYQAALQADQIALQFCSCCTFYMHCSQPFWGNGIMGPHLDHANEECYLLKVDP